MMPVSNINNLTRYYTESESHFKPEQSVGRQNQFDEEAAYLSISNGMLEVSLPACQYLGGVLYAI